MSNIAYIYQPHFKTKKFRVARDKQVGAENNFIVVTCSPEYNGVYMYPARYLVERGYELWENKGKKCICVPIDDCVKLKTLEELTNPEIVNRVKSQQKKWYDNEVRNRDYEYKEKPDWLL